MLLSMRVVSFDVLGMNICVSGTGNASLTRQIPLDAIFFYPAVNDRLALLKSHRPCADGPLIIIHN